MTVVSTEKDVDALTMTIVAEFDATVKRVWELWMDPRQLERWWGPPGWPATFESHDFRVAGRSAYYMTGPDGEKSHGWWEMTAVDEPSRLEFDDGFADADGVPVTTIEAAHVIVTIEAAGPRARMATTTNFPSVEVMEQMIQMGMEEGMRLAMGQIDGILAEN
jgi:uncharacterized protein YndB with AHSA1/START domain